MSNKYFIEMFVRRIQIRTLFSRKTPLAASDFYWVNINVFIWTSKFSFTCPRRSLYKSSNQATDNLPPTTDQYKIYWPK